MFNKNLSEHSVKVLECYFNDLLVKFERGESEELLVYLHLIEEEMGKRSVNI